MKKTLTLLTVLTVFLAGCDSLFGTKFPTATIIFAMNLISSIFVLQTAMYTPMQKSALTVKI